MKKLLMNSALAVSSLLAVTACANTSPATDTAPYSMMQNQNKMASGQHGSKGQMHDRMALGHHGSKGQMHNRMASGQHGSKGQMHNRMASGTNSPLHQLDLTASQKTQIQSIMQNNRGEPMQNHNAVLKILTPKQRTQLNQLMADRMKSGQ